MNQQKKPQEKDKTTLKVQEVQNVEELEITTVNNWKKDNLNIRKLLLPSGAVFKVKTVSLTNLAMKGVMLMPLLTSLIEKAETVKKSKKKIEDIVKKINTEEMTGLNEMINKVTLAAVLEPKLSLNGDKESISVDDIEFEDKMAVFENCVRGGAESFAGFLRK